MNPKRAGAPSKYDRGFPGQSRITERQKTNIADELEQGLARGLSRDEVLERLARKYHRSPRTIERYISKVKEKREAEANVVQARQQHWNDLADMARGAAERIFHSGFSDFGPLGSGRASHREPADPAAVRWLSELIVEIPLPFEHEGFSPSGEYLSQRWDNLVAHLEFEFKGFKDKLRDWKENAIWHQRWLIAGEAADLPRKASEIEDRLHSLTFEIMDVFNLVGERRTFKGTCEICRDW